MHRVLCLLTGIVVMVVLFLIVVGFIKFGEWLERKFGPPPTIVGIATCVIFAGTILFAAYNIGCEILRTLHGN